MEIRSMVTTNMASNRLPHTYIELKRECEKLLKIAEKLAAIAQAKSELNDDVEFLKLKDEFRQQLLGEINPRVFV
jgi:hypothetical protein